MSASTTVITVGYNSAEVIGTMLASIPEGTPVVVVDNASQDDTRTTVLALSPYATIVTQSENHGFGRACNLGAEAATTPYLLFLNPDAALSPGAIDALEKAADTLPGLVAANPVILDGKGRGRLKTSSALRLPRQVSTPQLDQPSEMPVLMGGAFFVRRSAFEAVGGFDPNIFLYHEDHDLSVRLIREGGRLWHVPDAKATHIAGTGTKRSAQAARFKGFHMARSRVYVLSNDGVAAPWVRVVTRALIGLLLPHNLLSARRRAKYLGQISGAWSARRDKGIYRPA